LNAAVQKAVNRIQPFESIARIADRAKHQGVTDVNIDLMYGLPMQTTEMVIREAELTIGLKPARVALFGYAHVPWMKSHQKLINEDDLPDADERWQQFEASSKKFIEAGYVAVGLDHFALPDDEMSVALDDGVLQRNFQGYTADLAPAMIGFGASAIGQLSQGYIQNLSPLKQYRENIAAGILPIARGIALSDDDRLRGHIIERIMCDLTVDLDEVCEKFATSKATFVPEMEKLASLADDAIITINGNTITVTETGRPFVRLVAAVFDAYLDSGKGRHSRAV